MFDAMGAELNAGTGKETTSVYARVLDVHLARGVRRDGGHGLAAALRRRRARAGARDRARGDRHVRGRPAGQGLRRARRGGLRRPPARPGDHRPRARSSAARRRRRCARSTPPATCPRTSSSRPPARSTTTRSSSSSARRGSSAPAGSRPACPRPPPDDPPRMRFVAKDTEQYHVCLGAPGIPRDDDRRFALRVLDNILGGTSSSRLFQEVREKRGLAYTVYSFQSHVRGDRPGRPVPRHATGQRRARDERRRRRARADARRPGDRRRARALEGEREGPDRAVARVDDRAHEPARRVGPRRHAAA